MNQAPVATSGRMSSNHRANPAASGASGDNNNNPSPANTNIMTEQQQQQPASNGASSWNVVVAKRHASSTKPSQARSRQGSSQPRAGDPKPWYPKQQQQQQQHHQQHAKNNSTNSNYKNNNTKPNNTKMQRITSNNNNNNNNNNKPQKKTSNNNISNNNNNNNNSSSSNNSSNNSNNSNTKKKVKPKPKIATVGDMLPGKLKKQSNDEKKKAIPQQQQRQHPAPRPIQSKQQLNLHTNNIQEFPALGASEFPALGSYKKYASASIPSVLPSSTPTARKGWGVVPPPPPPPVLSSSRTGVDNPPPPMASFSSPSKKKPQGGKLQVVGGVQPRILKRGEQQQPPPRGIATGGKKKKAHNNKKDAPAPLPPSGPAVSASSFFRPRLRETSGETNQAHSGLGAMDGDEHQLLRLLQGRTVYQKKGRQRVAPRKKKFTALKKKVLQERLEQWRELHPEELPNDMRGSSSTHDSAAVSSRSELAPPTRSLCMYNYAVPEELEDDDEYEEIVDNLKGMALKIGPVDEVFIPRSAVVGEEPNPNDDAKSDRHPAYVRFRNQSDASAALACWSGLVIGGSSLEVIGLDVPSDDTTDTPWPTSVVAAEAKWRRDSTNSDQPQHEEPLGYVSIVLQKVLTEDDFEDEDCMSESVADLEKISGQFGEVRDILADDARNGDVQVTYHCTLTEARTIAEKLCRVVLGGQPLYASVIEQPAAVSETAGSPMVVLLENILTEEDLEDSECLQESLNDIRELCMRHGEVTDVVVRGTAVKVTYNEEKRVAEHATNELNGIVLGGNTIRASLLADEASAVGDEGLENSIDLHNLITEDDLEDEDCMEESLHDVRELASRYGDVVSAEVLNASSDAFVRIRFGGDVSVAENAVKAFSGMVIGGQIIAALRSNANAKTPGSTDASKNPGDKRKPDTETKQTSDKKARTDDKEPLYSGDKLISERFAEMKRVPKIPNKGPRDYANTVNDERVKPLLSEMLGELMRLQKRAADDKNTKARRRMVMGLREVARGIRAHKVKMVVMANNLDDYGVIDEKLQEIIDLAKSEGVPLFFEFTKRSLGKAIGKSIKIAVVGIQNADGAHQPFKKLNAIARI